ncbi:hypothetical protein [Arthrobacter alpinus]|nr:hypothetical protein [Arthrobacter alpinus]
MDRYEYEFRVGNATDWTNCDLDLAEFEVRRRSVGDLETYKRAHT